MDKYIYIWSDFKEFVEWYNEWSWRRIEVSQERINECGYEMIAIALATIDERLCYDKNDKVIYELNWHT